MSFNIRKAQTQDVNSITEIVRELGWYSEPSDITQERASNHLTLCHSDNSHSVYVAEKDGEVIGYIAAHWLPYLFLAGPEGYVSELLILEASRGQGVGGQLLDQVKEEAQARGCSRLMLLCGRSQESYKRKFYDKQGWRERSDVAYYGYPLK